MNKTTKEKIEIMQAWVDGQAIEFKTENTNWRTAIRIDGSIDEPSWDWLTFDYRIKPQDKVKVYLYAYKYVNSPWMVTEIFYLGDSDFLEQLVPTPKSFKRLDYTEIEVDVDE